MSFSKYPAYKDSGVKWIGEIPAHWSLQRYKQVFAERDERSETGEEMLLSVSAYTGIFPRGEILSDGDFLSRAESLVGYKICYPNDLVMNIMLAWNRGLGFSNYCGIVSPAYSVFKLLSGNFARFLDYLVRSDEIILYYKAFSSGVIDSRLRLYPNMFGSLYCALPPLSEQQAIAHFLDRECGKIDALIAEQERLIALLAEKRQAVISNAVTKGLNPNAPMKDSGIPWIGMVPEGWEVGSFKHFVAFLDNRRIPLSSELRSERQGTFPYYGASGVIDYIDDYLFDEKTVLISEDGANLVNRTTPIAFVAEGRYWVNNHAHIVAPFDGQFLFWAHRIEEIDIFPFITGSAQPKFTIDALANLPVSAPNLIEEKKEISRYISKVEEQFIPLIELTTETVALLKERRAALISAAVTGKIDVRAQSKALTA